MIKNVRGGDAYLIGKWFVETLVKLKKHKNSFFARILPSMKSFKLTF